MHTAHAHTEVILRGRLSRLLTQADLSASATRTCRIGKDWPRSRAGGATWTMFLFAYLGDLADEIDVVTHQPRGLKRFILFEDATPIESVAELLARLDVRSAARLHVARLDRDSDESFLRRFLSGLHSDHDGAIMDAWWDGDELVVISPEMERLRVPGDKLPRLRNATRKDRREFEIDAEGAFLYWPSHDVHLGWSQFRQLIDPAAVLRVQQKSERFNRRYGEAIRTLREEHGLKQSDISRLDARTIRRIEKGQTRATTRALTRLAEAHGLAPNVYMHEVATRLAE